ncbi:MAG: hypothetical protein M1824_001935 [Vezdaea acicularis]|nr:MAG: hypothetical protein M1824_001935 [Vezdaea acicularis]
MVPATPTTSQSDDYHREILNQRPKDYPRDFFDEWISDDAFEDNNAIDAETSFKHSTMFADARSLFGDGLAAGTSDARHLEISHPWRAASCPPRKSSAASLCQPPEGNQCLIYSESSDRAAISDSELLSLEGRRPSSSTLLIHPFIPLSSSPSSTPQRPTASSSQKRLDRSPIAALTSSSHRRKNANARLDSTPQTHSRLSLRRMQSPQYCHAIPNTHPAWFREINNEFPLSPPPSARQSIYEISGSVLDFDVAQVAQQSYPNDTYDHGLSPCSSISETSGMRPTPLSSPRLHESEAKIHRASSGTLLECPASTGVQQIATPHYGHHRAPNAMQTLPPSTTSTWPSNPGTTIPIPQPGFGASSQANTTNWLSEPGASSQQLHSQSTPSYQVRPVHIASHSSRQLAGGPTYEPHDRSNGLDLLKVTSAEDLHRIAGIAHAGHDYISASSAMNLIDLPFPSHQNDTFSASSQVADLRRDRPPLASQVSDMGYTSSAPSHQNDTFSGPSPVADLQRDRSSLASQVSGMGYTSSAHSSTIVSSPIPTQRALTTRKSGRVEKPGRKKSPTTTTPTSTKSPGVVDFVNLTPDHGRKILSGVAPSGSSKTKAKREKETRERELRIIEAAKAGTLDGLLN